MTRKKQKESKRLIDKYGAYLEYYGDFRMGLTTKEIKAYLKDRNGGKLGKCYQEFKKAAGVNTMAVCRGELLMYRNDVKRFADLIFDGKKTYWD